MQVSRGMAITFTICAANGPPEWIQTALPEDATYAAVQRVVGALGGPMAHLRFGQLSVLVNKAALVGEPLNIMGPQSCGPISAAPGPQAGGSPQKSLGWRSFPTDRWCLRAGPAWFAEAGFDRRGGAIAVLIST